MAQDDSRQNAKYTYLHYSSYIIMKMPTKYTSHAGLAYDHEVMRQVHGHQVVVEEVVLW